LTFKSIAELVKEGPGSIKLNILVYGPQVSVPDADARIAAIQRKRKDIRQELIDLGHDARFAEELVDPSLPEPFDSAFYQEQLLQREADLIICIVESPGSKVEFGAIYKEVDVLKKTTIFLDENYIAGLVGDACRDSEYNGAKLKLFQYPRDIDECNLLGFALKSVGLAQRALYHS
jgi:hypothetical protein